jgi:hypothetical protein
LDIHFILPYWMTVQKGAHVLDMMINRR